MARPAAGIKFENVNKELTKKNIAKLVDSAYRDAGVKACVILCDRIKAIGYEYATRSGISIGVKDMLIPDSKKRIIDAASAEVDNIESQYRDGIITRTEKYNKVVDVWTKATQDVSAEMNKEISTDILTDPKTGKQEANLSFNPIFMMSNSGARGNADQMRQLAGMRGLMAKPSGEIIETPITASFREGLTVLQYFTSTHGARKGLADTALKTANSGYLTRRLVDVVQDVIVSEHDCGTVDGIEIRAIKDGGEVKQKLSERALGRVLLYPVYDPATGDLLYPENTLIDEPVAKTLDDQGHQLRDDPLRADLPVRARHLLAVLRARPCPPPPRQHRRDGRHHRGAVHRRTRHAAHHAYLPHRRYGVQGNRTFELRGAA